MASIPQDYFLKKRTMAKRFVHCSKCLNGIEAPPEAKTIYCVGCDHYSLVPKTAAPSQPTPDCPTRHSRRSMDSTTWQIKKHVNNPCDTQQRFKKRALLCGVSYNGNKHRLKGTINDVNKMQQFLIRRFNFSEQSIRVLTEEQSKEEDTPTRKNIENAFTWLVKDCRPGDSLVFYFSGHGLRQPDFEGDEEDGYDETLCPVDFRKEGMILDNDINTFIVKPLPAGVTLHAIIDACHSGTVLDLPYIYNRKSKTWDTERPPSGRPPKGTSGGRAICFSACSDNQKAVDTSILSEKGKRCFARRDMNGVMTTLFIQVIENCPDITYAKIIELVNGKIGEINARGGYLKRQIKKLFNYMLLQEPQLSSSENFDVNNEKFKL